MKLDVAKKWSPLTVNCLNWEKDSSNSVQCYLAVSYCWAGRSEDHWSTEGWSGAHMGNPERIDTTLNWTHRSSYCWVSKREDHWSSWRSINLQNLRQWRMWNEASFKRRRSLRCGWTLIHKGMQHSLLDENVSLLSSLQSSNDQSINSQLSCKAHGKAAICIGLSSELCPLSCLKSETSTNESHPTPPL